MCCQIRCIVCICYAYYCDLTHWIVRNSFLYFSIYFFAKLFPFTIFDCIACDVQEFSKQWYRSTIVSDENWVCSKDMYQTNTFVLNRIGEVIGTFFFGQLGDRWVYLIFSFILCSYFACSLSDLKKKKNSELSFRFWFEPKGERNCSNQMGLRSIWIRRKSPTKLNLKRIHT